MADDVVLNKIEIMERCIARVHEEYAGDVKNLQQNITKQDSIILNLERACQAAIDLGMRLVRKRRLGLPKESRECFEKLAGAGLIDQVLATKLSHMVGFRNLAIHDYQELNLTIVQHIIENELTTFANFRDAVFAKGLAEK